MRDSKKLPEVMSALAARRFFSLRGGCEELRRALGLRLLLRRRRLELDRRSVAPHRVHDRRELARDRRAGAFVAALRPVKNA